MGRYTAEQTHRIMSAVHSKNTKPELLLRRALWKLKCRYRINCKDVPGRPDIAIKKYKIAVYVDGDFWHGNNWKIRGIPSLEDELKRYTPYWREKILRNIERDLKVTLSLRDDGWIVLRFWESDIKKDVDACVREIIRAIKHRKRVSDIAHETQWKDYD